MSCLVLLTSAASALAQTVASAKDASGASGAGLYQPRGAWHQVPNGCLWSGYRKGKVPGPYHREWGRPACQHNVVRPRRLTTANVHFISIFDAKTGCGCHHPRRTIFHDLLFGPRCQSTCEDDHTESKHDGHASAGKGHKQRNEGGDQTDTSIVQVAPGRLAVDGDPRLVDSSQSAMPRWTPDRSWEPVEVKTVPVGRDLDWLRRNVVPSDED